MVTHTGLYYFLEQQKLNRLSTDHGENCQKYNKTLLMNYYLLSKLKQPLLAIDFLYLHSRNDLIITAIGKSVISNT